jgi:Tfp pilus assembly PilM family ATPase
VQYVSSNTTKDQQLYTSSFSLAISLALILRFISLIALRYFPSFFRFQLIFQGVTPLFAFLRKKPASLIGLEINTDEIKLLQLCHTAQGYTIENMAVRPLQEHVIVDDKIKRFDVVQTALRTIVQETNIVGCPAAIALPIHSVIIKQIRLAACLSEWECEVEIKASLPRYFPGVTEELCFDFSILPKTSADYHDILLVASRAEQVQMYTALVSHAGLDVKIVDVDAHALLRGAHLSLDPLLASVIGLCDVGRSVTRLLVFQRQQIIFMQQWPTADFSEWDLQIQRVVQRFLAMHREVQMQVLLLSGEMVHAIESLQALLEMPVQIANPFKNMQLGRYLSASDLSQHASRFQVCCGLATRSLP